MFDNDYYYQIECCSRISSEVFICIYFFMSLGETVALKLIPYFSTTDF